MKRKSRIQKTFISLMGATAIFMSVSCDKKETFTVGNIDVWSTYNTTKVMREKYDYTKLSPALNVEMARSEVEGAQLIITPDYDVRSYDLVLSDLTCGENVFPKENITAYKQGYVNVETKTADQTNTAYPTGWIPDFMLPLEKAREYGETSITNGHNQGITVGFSSTVDTAPGVYTGNFTLVVDGKETDIPVSVEVWDIDVSKVYGKSYFGNGIEEIMSGELSNDLETMSAIYEYLLENRVSPGYFPQTDNGSVEGFIDGYKKYSTHKYFASFGIPVYRAKSKYKPNTNLYYQYVKELAKLATPENPVFDKAYVYVVTIDEPHTQEAFDAVANYREGIDSVEEKVYKELVNEGFFKAFMEKGYTSEQVSTFESAFKDSLYNVPQVITTPYNQTLKDAVHTYCPTIDDYDTQYKRDLYAKNAEVNNSEQWFYDTMNPIYPYPTFHIDDYLIGARIRKWIQAAYNVEGYLYWSCVELKNTKLDSIITDPYTNPDRYRFGTTDQYPGEGYLIYPGAGYGESKPFGSLRLFAYRDGQEDMDMIKEFDRLLDENESYYGAEFSANAMLQTEYNKIFTGAIYNENDETFYNVRRITADLYAKAKSSAKFVISDTAVKNSVATTNVYLADGYKLKVNGTEITTRTQSGEGWKYTLTTDLLNENAEYKIEVYDLQDKIVLTYDRFAYSKFYKTTLSGENFAVSENSTVHFTETGAEIKLVSKGEGYTQTEQLKFTPTITFDETAFGGKVYNLKDIRFTMTNANDFDVKFEIWLGSTRSKYKFTEIVLPANSTDEYIIENIYNANWASLRTANKLMFTFANSDSNSVPFVDRNLSVCDVTYTLK